jgi:hypothetical protein
MCVGVGDLIVRGSWDAVWGILEDIRRRVDGLPAKPQIPLSPTPGLRETPYLGPIQGSVLMGPVMGGSGLLGYVYMYVYVLIWKYMEVYKFVYVYLYIHIYIFFFLSTYI